MEITCDEICEDINREIQNREDNIYISIILGKHGKLTEREIEIYNIAFTSGMIEARSIIETYGKIAKIK
jgi:hypothetical protein